MEQKTDTATLALASFNHEAVDFQEIDKSSMQDAVVALLQDALRSVNEKVGKPLYALDSAKEEAYLANVSHLYGAFTKDNRALIAVIAVEEDAVERIAVAAHYQRQGIGAALMAAARIAFGAEYVDVYADNKQGLAFFEAQGLSMFDETAPEPGDLSAVSPYKIIHLMY